MSLTPAVAPRPFRLSRTLTFDLITSYAATFARAGSMLAIVSLLAHRTTAGYLAAFLFLRAILGFLNNVFVGAGPAAIAALQRSTPTANTGGQPTTADTPFVALPIAATAAVLSYESKTRPAPPPRREVTSTWSALLLASVAPGVTTFLVIVLCTPLLVAGTAPLARPPGGVMSVFTIAFAGGLLTRLTSDAAGGVLQARRMLWLDNLLVAAAEAAWVGFSFASASRQFAETFSGIAIAYLSSGVLLFGGRWIAAAALLIEYEFWWIRFNWPVALRFLAVAGTLALASLGDFLYAPANYVIIRKFLDPLLIADYGPALQVDALLLLAVAALAGVILPRAVSLHAAGEFAALRRAYVAATLVGTLLLAGGAGLVLTFSDRLLRLWLGEVPSGTRAILPWVLVHTVVGGTAGIARAVMIGMGRLRAYTIATLSGGVLNVSLALLFVAGFGWGLRGIVLATILTVTLRNAIWMPWYIVTRLRTQQRPSIGESS